MMATKGDKNSRAAGMMRVVPKGDETQNTGQHTWDPKRKARVIEFVSETTKMAQGMAVLDRTKGDRSETTKAVYERLAAPRVDLMAEGAGGLLDGVKRASFDTTRSAVLHKLATLYQEHRRAGDDEKVDMKAWEMHHRLARRAVEAFAVVLATERPEERAPKASKRRTLPPPSWQRVVFDAADADQRPAVAVMWATGCRPAEIEQGIDIERTADGIIVRIPGAKVTDTKGQPTRAVLISLESDAGRALLSVLGDEKVMTVSRTAKQVANDFTKHLKKRTGMLQVSAYSFRHQMASDLKSTGADPVKIAEAMGHTSVHTQRHYGSKKRGGGVSAVKDAQAEREVRVPKREGLEATPGRDPS